MTDVLLMSMCANSENDLPVYKEQIRYLRNHLSRRGDTLQVLVCEGDSTDGTWQWLNANMPEWVTLMKHDHGGEIYGSQVNGDRFRQLSEVWNAMLDRVATMRADVVVLVEDDLIWDTDNMIGLIDGQKQIGGVVCPLIYMGRLFYDIWAYRRNGINFQNWPRPFHPDLKPDTVALELDSAGSCLVMSHDIAATCRTTPEEELVGFCQNIREAGHSIHLLPGYAIDHPLRSTVAESRYRLGHLIAETAG